MSIDLTFIIQIVLTVVVWIRGWKWKALIPVAVGFASGFIVPSFVSPESSSFSNVALFINIGIIVALIVMAAKPELAKKAKK